MNDAPIVPIASLWSRFVAMIIDAVVLFIPMSAFHAGLPFLGPAIVTFLYYPIFHASPARATPGKRAMDLQVTDSKGETLSFGMAFLRQLFFLGSTGICAIGLLVAFFTKRKQAVHDLVADSIVVKGRNNEITTVDAWMQTVRKLFSKLG